MVESVCVFVVKKLLVTPESKIAGFLMFSLCIVTFRSKVLAIC